MPAAVNPSASTTLRGGHEESRPRISQPLEYSGSLDSYSKSDLTPVIGREYKGLQVADVLKSESRDRLIRDLAVTSTLPFSLSYGGSTSLTIISFATGSGIPPRPRCYTPADARVWRESDQTSWMCAFIFICSGSVD